MISVDTSVLSYAVGEEHPMQEPCRRLLNAHRNGLVEATTTVEVIQEFVHVRARHRPRQDAVTLARHYAAAFSLLTTEMDDLELALTFYERHPRLGAFDAALAAVAVKRRAEALISSDRAFGTISELPWVDPATPMLDQLLMR